MKGLAGRLCCTVKGVFLCGLLLCSPSTRASFFDDLSTVVVYACVGACVIGMGCVCAQKVAREGWRPFTASWWSFEREKPQKNNKKIETPKGGELCDNNAPIGIKNKGADCFVIAAISPLLYSEKVKNLVLESADEILNGKSDVLKRFFELMINIHTDDSLKNGKRYLTGKEMKPFYDALFAHPTLKNLNYKRGFQDDSGTILKLLLDEMAPIAMKKGIVIGLPMVAHERFREDLEITEQKYAPIFQLPYKTSSSIMPTACFKELLKPPANKELFYTTLGYDNPQKNKISPDVFCIQAHLNLSVDLASSIDMGKMGIEGKFKVKAFNVHSGSNPQFGHYVAYNKQGNEWYECDDDKVNKVEETKVKKILAGKNSWIRPYVILYERSDKNIKE